MLLVWVILWFVFGVSLMIAYTKAKTFLELNKQPIGAGLNVVINLYKTYSCSLDKSLKKQAMIYFIWNLVSLIGAFTSLILQ